MQSFSGWNTYSIRHEHPQTAIRNTKCTNQQKTDMSNVFIFFKQNITRICTARDHSFYLAHIINLSHVQNLPTVHDSVRAGRAHNQYLKNREETIFITWIQIWWIATLDENMLLQRMRRSDFPHFENLKVYWCDINFAPFQVRGTWYAASPNFLLLGKWQKQPCNL